MAPLNPTHASAITRPSCPKCGTAMMVVRIEPHTPGQQMRTFECPSCDWSESEVVAF
jgi:transposase-like protein